MNLFVLAQTSALAGDVVRELDVQFDNLFIQIVGLDKHSNISRAALMFVFTATLCLLQAKQPAQSPIR